MNTLLASASEQRAQRAVQAWLGASSVDWNITRSGALQGVDHPGSSGQAVFQFLLEGPARSRRDVVAKCLHRAPALPSARVLDDLHRALSGRRACLRTPRPLHLDAAQAVLLQECARGRTLAEFSAGETPALADAVECCGRALGELHALPLELLGGLAPAPADITGQLAVLARPAPAVLAQRCPALRQRILALLRELEACEAACERVPDVPLHRDVHPRQLFVEGERVTLIDWDLCGAGDPALDLANLLMHLELRWPQQAALLQSRLLAGWWSQAAPVGPPEAAAHAALARRLHLYRAFHALRRACKAWRVAAGEDGLARARTPTAADPSAIAAWVDAAGHHLRACRASPQGPACPSRAAAEIQP